MRLWEAWLNQESTGDIEARAGLYYIFGGLSQKASLQCVGQAHETRQGCMAYMTRRRVCQDSGVHMDRHMRRGMRVCKVSRH